MNGFSVEAPKPIPSCPLCQIRKESGMKEDSLKELFIEKLKDLYSAETQLVKALPKMATARRA
jgi:hypothetical protein